MSRLANTEKAGYFPLVPSVTDLILTHITAPHGGRILDPCAGEGTALVTLADRLGLDPFGIELHEGRAQAAREAVNQLLATRQEAAGDTAVSSPTRILHGSFLSLVTSRGGYNLLYVNPPYNYDEEHGRLEYQWLVHTCAWLQPGGLLVWVVYPSTSSSFARPPATSSPGTTGCRYTASPMTATTGSNRSSSLASTGPKRSRPTPNW
jgi:16S rRNA G966 N2-methylase RsmD